MELLCTNKLLPKHLGVGDICRGDDNAPTSVTFSNITPVNPPLVPPLDNDMMWKLISNMKLNYIPFTDINAIRSVLSIYDFKSMHAKQGSKVLTNLLNGLTDIKCVATDRIYRGLPLRGAITTLYVNKDNFSCLGEIYLFCSVINEFLAMYTTINSFHQLQIFEEKTGEQYKWPARLGRRVL
jgi:type VI secretion system protein ImpG